MKYNYKVGDKVIVQNSDENAVFTIKEVGNRTVLLDCVGWIEIDYIKPSNKGEQMTNKQEAKQQLEKLEAEVQKLKEIINKPEKAGSLLEDGLYHLANGGSTLVSYTTGCKHGYNSFNDELIAQAYAEAFNTMLALRKCDGSEVANKISAQYSIELDASTTDLIVGSWSGLSGKLFQISPVFSSKEYAQAAIDKVGKDSIIKMFKTLHGIYV